MQKEQGKLEDLGFCPSFSCYSSDSLTAMAANKVSTEAEKAAAAAARCVVEFSDDDEEDFEFSLVLADVQVSAEDIAPGGKVFPVFNRDLLIKDEEVDREEKGKDAGNGVSSAIGIPLQKLFFEDREESASSSSSEADELESLPSGTYCVWRPKVPPSPLTKCKKSSSTGSGSKRWRIRDLLRRSNSEGKEPMLFLTPKKTDGSKNKRNSGQVSLPAGKSKAPPSPSVHEMFYVQKRAQKEEGKRKSYLPYRRDLVGFFANVNGMGKMLPF